jgi:hypothetical protein
MGDSSAAKITFLGIFCDFFVIWVSVGHHQEMVNRHPKTSEGEQVLQIIGHPLLASFKDLSLKLVIIYWWIAL